MDFVNLQATTTATSDVHAVAIEHEISDSIEQELQKLAELSSIEYERRRKTEVKRLGIRGTVLDTEIKARRRNLPEVIEEQDDSIFETVTPHPDPVDTADLLEEISSKLTRHASLPVGAADAIALWILNTYTYKAFTILPKLLLTSPVMRCGKTTVLEMVGRCVHNPLFTANITTASLYRTIDQWEPTVMIDEGDTFLNYNKRLTGIINSGHSSKVSDVIRCEKAFVRMQDRAFRIKTA